VTRRRAKTAYRTVQVLSLGPYARDEIIQVGQYRSSPCTHPRRLVSVLWQGAWYRYLTNVLDPQALGEPLERISMEMVFRAFYHYSRAVQHGDAA
jgi:hypothetical protein